MNVAWRQFGVALTGMAVLAFGATARAQLAKRSLQPGIAQTQRALQQVDQLIQGNQADMNQFLTKLATEFAIASSNFPDPDALKRARDAIDLAKQFANSYGATSALQIGDYANALQNAATAIAAVWGVLDPTIKFGKGLVDVATMVYEAQALLSQQATLVATRISLEQQLARLQGRDPQNAAEWNAILNALRGDPAAEHAAFLQWLAAHGLSEQDLLSKAMHDAQAASPRAAKEVARGAVILDPDKDVCKLAAIPGINPDFIRSTREQIGYLNQGDPWTAGMLNKTNFSDPTSYVPIFGSAKTGRPTGCGASAEPPTESLMVLVKQSVPLYEEAFHTHVNFIRLNVLGSPDHDPANPNIATFRGSGFSWVALFDVWSYPSAGWGIGFGYRNGTWLLLPPPGLTGLSGWPPGAASVPRFQYPQ